MNKRLPAILLALLVSVVFSQTPSAQVQKEELDTATGSVSSLETLVSQLRTKLFSSDGGEHDCFGRSLAIDGEYMIVGAKGDDDGGADAGAAYIFRRINGEWVEQTKLTASDSDLKDFFAFSVDIDGDTAVAGAWLEDEKASGAGAAYVFDRRGDQWVESAKLMASDGAAFDNFGFSIALKGDTIVVGAREADPGAESAGAAYVFERHEKGWTQAAKLVASDPSERGEFGTSVAISGDLIVVGSMRDGDEQPDSGAAYIFERGKGWAQTARLGAIGARAGDSFGWSVGVSGETVVVGAYGSDEVGSDSGAAFIFERHDDQWTQTAMLSASDSLGNELFGWSVDIHDETVVIGAWQDAADEIISGSAYVFKRNPLGWSQATKLVSSSPRDLDLFGWAVGVSSDTVVVGARFDDLKAMEAGAVYVY